MAGARWHRELRPGGGQGEGGDGRGRRARWQLLGVVGQEGGGVREPDGSGGWAGG